MVLSFLLTTFVCPKTQIVDTVKAPWVEQDQVALESATKRCVKHYPASPCLVKFTRYAVGSYHATCGKELKQT